MHGAGNDYVFIDAKDLHEDWPALAISMSDRHLGVGSDGIILSLPSEHADIRMRMFNSDGSEGEMCGNGIRCLVGFALAHEIIPSHLSPVTVDTLAGIREVTPIWNGHEVTRAKVSMGKPIMTTINIPANAPDYEMLIDHSLVVGGMTFKITCVSMGNPHAVAFLDSPVDDFPLEKIGPLVETHPLFPQKINFEIANVITQNLIKARVWERGSGLTMACGSGACAIAVAGFSKTITSENVSISLPGGQLEVSWDGCGEVVLDGPVQRVFDGEWLI